ncbi:apolipoprotein L6 [Onychomys torridus]|uniref:apolipoprotein L6 n=1 Tax=Onychomys torridus TaxID=38674 RepID=UPI00167FD234|nr:apolipoprotein L6 [Onychomys torridus]XP_036064308.1 apolipoprotein L6 [Onychomys torridus]
MMNHPTGKEYEADTDLQRDEDGGPLGGDSTDEGEVEVEDDALTDEERTFLKQFPSWKKETKKHIRKLRVIADGIDKSHQKATKTNVVSNSASAISGIMSLLGLALAPATAGGSLVFTAAGTGLGVVAGVTNIVTKVKESSRNKRALAEANRIMPTSDQELENVRGKKTAYVTATGEIISKCGTAWETIKNHIRALQLTKTHPHVASAAKKLMSAGQASAQTGRQVQKAFGGTALAMTKNALMKNGLLAAFFLFRDIHSLYEGWKELEAATPTELAKELRERAEVLDRVLSEHTRRYKRLKKKLRDSQKRPLGSSLKTAMETQPPPLSSIEKARPRGQWHRGAEVMGL